MHDKIKALLPKEVHAKIPEIVALVEGEVRDCLKETRFHEDIHTSENLGIQKKVLVVHKETIVARLEALFSNKK